MLMSTAQRVLFILILVSGIFSVKAQSSIDEQLDSLNKEEIRVESEIQKTSILLRTLKAQLNKIQNVKKTVSLTTEKNSFTINATLRMESIVWDTPDEISHSKVGKVKFKQKVMLIGYSRGYFLIEKPNGYLSQVALNQTSDILDLLKTLESDEKEKEKNQLKEEKNKQKENREKILVAKYGYADAQKIIKKWYWIGMTSKMAEESLGPPEDINSTVGSWGEHEQWVYSNGLYLYFENGLLKSYQK